MKAFAALCDQLARTTRPEGKIRLLGDYFSRMPDPERGWAVGLLADAVSIPALKPSVLKEVAAEQLDPHHLALSQDYVGDLAETISLIWADEPQPCESLDISNVISKLQQTVTDDLPQQIPGWLDRITISERYTLLKLLTGGLRVGITPSLLRRALAAWGRKPVSEIDELWSGLTPPYGDLFAWLCADAPPPQIDQTLAFRAQMPSQPVDTADLLQLAPSKFVAEWKWDGIRALLVTYDGKQRLYSRAGDEIGHQFPEILAAAAQINADGILDGELIVVKDERVAPISDLQKRLNRKSAPKSLQTRYPARLRAFDMLFDGWEDLRPLPFWERRARLEDWYRPREPSAIDLSPLIPFADWDALTQRRESAMPAGADGLMLKRRDSAYDAGAADDGWLKWAREPFSADCVLMYAQPGQGGRQAYYAEFTLGCWRDAPDGTPELVPVGKAWPSLSDEEHAEIDAWIRSNATEKFGPVRAVAPGLVFEIAFDAVHPSARHKSGLTLRAPRILRLRRDMPTAKAGRLEQLSALIT